MPNPQNKKSTQKIKSTYRHSPLFWAGILLLLIVAVSAGGYGIWRYENNRAIAADRARFERADRDIQILFSRINKVLPGQGYFHKENCQTHRYGYEVPSITCNLLIKIIYPASSSAEAGSLAVKIDDITSSFTALSKDKTIAAPNAPSNLSFPIGPIGMHQSQSLGVPYHNRSTGIPCTESFELFNSDNPPYAYSGLVSKLGLTLNVAIDCSDTAKSAYFPIQD